MNKLKSFLKVGGNHVFLLIQYLFCHTRSALIIFEFGYSCLSVVFMLPYNFFPLHY